MQDVHLSESEDEEQTGVEMQNSPGNMMTNRPITCLPVEGSYASPRHVGAAGRSRYLKPSELNEEAYDFAVLANRSVNVKSSWFCCFSWCESKKNERQGFRRLCPQSSPLLHESEDAHRRIVEKLTEEGLWVDIIDGGHSEGDMTSDYFVLLIRASEEVFRAYTRKQRQNLWLKHGHISDFELDFGEDGDPPTPAERIQIVDYIIEQRAGLNISDPWIHDMFPVHDPKVTDQLVREWISSRFGRLEYNDKEFINTIRYNFGEKVAYYFAFIHYYNRAAIPLAVLGLLVFLLKNVIGTTSYMRILPLWGFFVSIIWAFMFIKRWDRENAALQYRWNSRLHSTQIEYDNKFFHGTLVQDPVTGEKVVYYSLWKRVPKYVCLAGFMILQISVMLVLVALWISIYEILKVEVPDSHFLSLQWFLILAEGIVFGLFVDVIQWNIVVTRIARLFTHWQNYRTEEAFESALIRQLFIMDFLNYYTWFFSLAFVYVIPGLGEGLTNYLNHIVFGDPMMCCFGPYVLDDNTCRSCPGDESAFLSSDCQRCEGWFTFDRKHVDLAAMFVTPIIVTQSLNMVLKLVMPIFVKTRRARARAEADARAHINITEKGSMKILGSMDYHDDCHNLGNKSTARYLEYTAMEIEKLNAKARDIMFESEQDRYDPYNDFHVLTVQFGFIVMFSILWPLMPLACMVINSLKMRADGYRLCRTLKRPDPRRANGIGEWRSVLIGFAFISILVNIALVCFSTGVLEFFQPDCVEKIEQDLKARGKDLSDFVFGPNYKCISVQSRLLIVILLEHVGIALVLVIMYGVSGVPLWIRKVLESREKQFKTMLQENASNMPLRGIPVPKCPESSLIAKLKRPLSTTAACSQRYAPVGEVGNLKDTPGTSPRASCTSSDEEAIDASFRSQWGESKIDQPSRKDSSNARKVRADLASQWGE